MIRRIKLWPKLLEGCLNEARALVFFLKGKPMILAFYCATPFPIHGSAAKLVWRTKGAKKVTITEWGAKGLPRNGAIRVKGTYGQMSFCLCATGAWGQTVMETISIQVHKYRPIDFNLELRPSFQGLLGLKPDEAFDMPELAEPLQAHKVIEDSIKCIAPHLNELHNASTRLSIMSTLGYQPKPLAFNQSSLKKLETEFAKELKTRLAEEEKKLHQNQTPLHT